ncbi:ionotropic receptor 75a-like isoform X1 [Rhynchophorus ferrugineus]|uniref:ionotropic receptor 75a-like isoform X1 n=1 Tax=Rhynchophorus ferrugineus TaxID=354439 RepID=UPI003FCE939B
MFCLDKSIFIHDYAHFRGPNAVIQTHICWKIERYITMLHTFIDNGIKFLDFGSKIPGHNPAEISKTYITDAECPFFNDLMKNALEEGLLAYPNRWIIFGHYDVIIKENHYFPINSYVLIVDNSTEKETFDIISPYKIKKDHQNYMKHLVGRWSRVKGFWFYNELILTTNRTNMWGTPLIVSYIFQYNSSLNHIYDYRERHLDKITKINYLLFDILVDVWNMTHEKLFTNEYGMELHPVLKFYKGMLGDIYQGRADIAGTLAFTPKERFQYFKFLVGTIPQLALDFIFRAPPLSYTANIFALPFHTYVWYACGLTLILCGVVITVIVSWEEDKEPFIQQRERDKEQVPTILDIIMMQIAVLCQMDFFYQLRSSSGRVATFTLLLTFIYIYTAFSARIVLLLQATSDTIKDMQTLYDSNIKIGVEDLNYYRFYFKNPSTRTREYWRKLYYDNRIAPKSSAKEHYYSTDEGMGLVQTSFFAFVIERTTANNLVEKSYTIEEKCAIRYIETFLISDVVHLFSKRNSTMNEFFLNGFRRLAETGLHHRQLKRFITKIPKCSGSTNIFVSVGLKESYFAFCVFLVGVILSLFLFVLEHAAHLYLRHRNFNDNVTFIRKFSLPLSSK